MSELDHLGPGVHTPVDDRSEGAYDLYREYFVANFMDGDDGGIITVKGSVLADEVADMFSSGHWRETWNAALFASLRASTEGTNG